MERFKFERKNLDRVYWGAYNCSYLIKYISTAWFISLCQLLWDLEAHTSQTFLKKGNRGLFLDWKTQLLIEKESLIGEDDTSHHWFRI